MAKAKKTQKKAAKKAPKKAPKKAAKKATKKVTKKTTKASKPSKSAKATKQEEGSGAVRKITKTGRYTYYVTIPKSDLTALGWKERQRVRVKRSGQKIVIEDLKKR